MLEEPDWELFNFVALIAAGVGIAVRGGAAASAGVVGKELEPAFDFSCSDPFALGDEREMTEGPVC